MPEHLWEDLYAISDDVRRALSPRIRGNLLSGITPPRMDDGSAGNLRLTAMRCVSSAVGDRARSEQYLQAERHPCQTGNHGRAYGDRKGYCGRSRGGGNAR